MSEDLQMMGGFPFTRWRLPAYPRSTGLNANLLKGLLQNTARLDSVARVALACKINNRRRGLSLMSPWSLGPGASALPGQSSPSPDFLSMGKAFSKGRVSYRSLFTATQSNLNKTVGSGAGNGMPWLTHTLEALDRPPGSGTALPHRLGHPQKAASLGSV